MYVTDSGAADIRKITTATGAVSSVTNGIAGNPIGGAIDSTGVIYFCDRINYTVRKYQSFSVSDIAGNGMGATDGTGTAARFNNPSGVVPDGMGNVKFRRYCLEKSAYSAAGVGRWARSVSGEWKVRFVNETAYMLRHAPT